MSPPGQGVSTSWPSDRTRPARTRPEGDVMTIGGGIFLIVVGLVLIMQVFPDIPRVDDSTLGWILLVVGVVAVALTLVINQQRTRTTHVEERRYDDGRRY